MVDFRLRVVPSIFCTAVSTLKQSLNYLSYFSLSLLMSPSLSLFSLKKKERKLIELKDVQGSDTATCSNAKTLITFSKTKKIKKISLFKNGCKFWNNLRIFKASFFAFILFSDVEACPNTQKNVPCMYQKSNKGQILEGKKNSIVKWHSKRANSFYLSLLSLSPPPLPFPPSPSLPSCIPPINSELCTIHCCNLPFYWSLYEGGPFTPKKWKGALNV